jgi:hypothetical protein
MTGFDNWTSRSSRRAGEWREGSTRLALWIREEEEEEEEAEEDDEAEEGVESMVVLGRGGKEQI